MTACACHGSAVQSVVSRRGQVQHTNIIDARHRVRDIYTCPINFSPLSFLLCASSLLFLILTPQRRALPSPPLLGHPSSKYHGQWHPFVRVRKESQGSCPPRGHRLHDPAAYRRPYAAILAYLLQPVSPRPYSLRSGPGYLMLCARPRLPRTT
jgi:hypothetical protein